MWFSPLRVPGSPAAGLAHAASEPRAPASLPEGYGVYARAEGDFDGDGRPETAYALEWKGPSLDHPPRLWVMKGSRRLLDLWLAETNALLHNVGPEQRSLQVGDLTGDGRPEIMFAPVSAGGSGGSIFPRVATWKGGKFENLRLHGRTVNHLSENGGAVIRSGGQNRPAVLILFDLDQPGPRRYRAQRFTYRGGQLVGQRERLSRARGEAGLRELGIK